MKSNLAILLFLCSVVFAGFGLASVQSGKFAVKNAAIPVPSKNNVVATSSGSLAVIIAPPETIPSPTENAPFPTTSVPVQNNLGTQAFVTRVVDGDTIDVSLNNSVDRVRLIGINSPETVDPKKPVQCYGPESSNEMKSLVSGKTVFLESDSSQTDKDKYGRLLRYIFLADGTDINLVMIREGFAYEYTYKIPYQYQAEFRSAQEDAKQNGRGLWSACK